MIVNLSMLADSRQWKNLKFSKKFKFSLYNNTQSYKKDEKFQSFESVLLEGRRKVCESFKKSKRNMNR